MPRKPRKLSSTGIYHIMARGIDRMAIFHDDEDREKYLEILADCLPGDDPSWGTVLSVTPKVGLKNCPRSDLPTSALEDGSLVPASCDKETVPKSSASDRPQVPAILYQYCLMDNHVHLLLKTGSESLSHLMKRIGVRYAAYFKWKYHRTGHLFQDRFRSEPVEDDSYLLAVYRYIALNPVKAGLCEKPGAYQWCGFHEPSRDASSWGTVSSVTPKVGLKNRPRSDLPSTALEDGSLVPASCDKGDRPQAQASCDKETVPKCRQAVTKEPSPSETTNKFTSHTTDTIPLPALPPAATWTALSARWRARFFASLRRGNMFFRCGYSVVDAIHLMETGEGPLVSVSAIRPLLPVQRPVRWQSASGG